MIKTIIVIGLILLFLSAYFSFFGTVAFVSGALWALINLYFIRQLLYELLIETPRNFPKIALLVLIKFPLLYWLGFALLYYQSDYLWASIAGFSLSLIAKAFQPQQNKEMA